MLSFNLHSLSSLPGSVKNELFLFEQDPRAKSSRRGSDNDEDEGGPGGAPVSRFHPTGDQASLEVTAFNIVLKHHVYIKINKMFHI